MNPHGMDCKRPEHELETLLKEIEFPYTGDACVGPCEDCQPKKDVSRLMAALRIALKQRDDGIHCFYETPEQGILKDEIPYRIAQDVREENKEVLAALRGEKI